MFNTFLGNILHKENGIEYYFGLVNIKSDEHIFIHDHVLINYEDILYVVKIHSIFKIGNKSYIDCEIYENSEEKYVYNNINYKQVFQTCDCLEIETKLIERKVQVFDDYPDNFVKNNDYDPEVPCVFFTEYIDDNNEDLVPAMEIEYVNSYFQSENENDIIGSDLLEYIITEYIIPANDNISKEKILQKVQQFLCNKMNYEDPLYNVFKEILSKKKCIYKLYTYLESIN